MLIQRILTAAALLAGFVGALLWLDGTWFASIVVAVIALGAAEWARLAERNSWQTALYAVFCAALFALLYWGPAQGRGPVLWAAAVFWVLVVPIWLALGVRADARRLLLLAGIVALVPAAAALALLSPRFVLLTLGLVWIADTAAYFTGRAFGRRKLAPQISPGKTWEGVAGGAVAVLIYAIICATLDPVLEARVLEAGWAPYLAGIALLCAASIVGDLFESALKRQAGAKDSGALLPGHGGVLDRIDSALAALPLALFLYGATAQR